MADEIRVGKVSSISANGMMKVTYTDRDGAVTAEMPCLNTGGEYRAPDIGESVLVAHLSNGSSRGVILGTMWNRSNQPKETGRGIYRKDMSPSGDAYQRYSDSAGLFEICAPDVSVSANLMLKIDAEQFEAALKTAIFDAVEKIYMKSGKGITLKASSELEMEDARWKTSLGDIMQRLSALDGDTTGRK